MSSSAGSFIGFGYAFPAGTFFPWNDEPFGGKVDVWWRSVNGFRDVHESHNGPGNEREDWNGRDPKIVDEVFESRRLWHERNPAPVELRQFGELCCSRLDETWALIVPGIGCDTKDDEDVELFDPSTESFALSYEQRCQLDDFVAKYAIIPKEQPSWMVCCYY